MSNCRAPSELKDEIGDYREKPQAYGESHGALIPSYRVEIARPTRDDFSRATRGIVTSVTFEYSNGLASRLLALGPEDTSG